MLTPLAIKHEDFNGPTSNEYYYSQPHSHYYHHHQQHYYTFSPTYSQIPHHHHHTNEENPYFSTYDQQPYSQMPSNYNYDLSPVPQSPLDGACRSDSIVVELLNRPLWLKFAPHTLENIITKRKSLALIFDYL